MTIQADFTPRKPTDDDREFWIARRAALLAEVRAIEKRWHLGSYVETKNHQITDDKEKEMVNYVIP